MDAIKWGVVTDTGDDWIEVFANGMLYRLVFDNVEITNEGKYKDVKEMEARVDGSG